MPKAYERIEGGTAVERYILLPDMAGGRLVRSRNRNLFFSKDDKINLRLPALVIEFQARQEAHPAHDPCRAPQSGLDDAALIGAVR
jgi:hypothetical protein